MFKRRRSDRSGSGRPAVREGDVARGFLEGEAPAEIARLTSDQALRELRAITAEAVILQDAVEELLFAIRDRRPLAELAPRGGPMISRFLELKARLVESADTDVRRYTTVLRAVFDHHALVLSSSLDLLAVDWRSEAVLRQLEKIDGLGPPAQWLEAVRNELVARTESLLTA